MYGKAIGWLFFSLLAMVVVVGCGGSGKNTSTSASGGGSTTSSSVEGIWVGPYYSARLGSQTATITLTQSGGNVTGTFVSTSGDTGNITGSMSGNTLTMQIANSTAGCTGVLTSTATFHFSATANFTDFSYGGTTCTGYDNGSGTLKRSPPAALPSGGVVLLTPSASSVVPGNVVFIQAIPVIAGTRSANVDMIFTLQGNTGVLDGDSGKNVTSVHAVTDSSGVASISYQPDKIGVASITATVTGNKDKGTVQIGCVANGEPANLQIYHNWQQYSSSNEAKQIIVLLLDTNNVPVPGKTLEFSATNGTLSRTSMVTDSKGEVLFTFTSSPGSSSVVTAKYSDSVAAWTRIDNVDNGLAPAILTGSVDNTTIINKNITVLYDFYVTDQFGGPSPDVNVTFTSTAGTLLSTDSYKTDSSGHVKVSLMGTVKTQFLLTAKLADYPQILGQSYWGFVTSNPYSPAQIKNIPPASQIVVGKKLPISILVQDGRIPPQPVSAGITVNFETTGGVLSAPSALTDSHGVASVTLSGISKIGDVANVGVSVNTDSIVTGVLLMSRKVTAIDYPKSVSSVKLTSKTITVNADGTTVKNLTAVVTMLDPLFDIEGIPIDFSFTSETGAGTLTIIRAYTGAEGQASSQFLSVDDALVTAKATAYDKVGVLQLK